MNATLTKTISALDGLVNYFIPPAIAADRELRQRTHVFLVSHILGPFIGNVVPIALYVLDPAPGYQVAVLAVAITSFWMFPFLLKAGAPYNPLALVSIQNLIFCILWSCYFYGGVTSPTLPWVLTIPLLAFFYLGASPRLRLIFIGMFAANLLVFFTLHAFAPSTAKDLPIDAMQGLGLVSTCAASIYTAMMALYYASVLASQGELEAEMRGHLSTAVKLRAATEEAQRAGAAKAEFLAKMSHELRTPLNAVIGYSQILLEDAEDEGDKDSVDDLQKIHDAGQHLLKLVSEILDLSKIEAGKMDLHVERAAADRLVREAIAANADFLRSRGNVVNLDIAADLGHVAWDIGKFRTIFSQIYDNAHKFTDHGSVTVEARRSTERADFVEIAICDTGIGIAPQDIGRLFEKFTVVDDASNSKYGGTGLGLALAQKLCQMMGGSITVESRPGVGSRFTISLPVTVAAGPNADPYAAATLVPELDPVPGKAELKKAIAHG